MPFILIGSLGVLFLNLPSNNEIIIGLAVIYTAASSVMAAFIDRYRRSIRIDCVLAGIGETISRALAEAFTDLRNCGAVWNIHARGNTSDWKRNAGASQVASRQRIFPSEKRPSCIRGNAKFPALKIGVEELFFAPDAILIVAGRSVAALQYHDLIISVQTIRFIENEAVPADADVVGTTWRFVNKSGGPDKRFSSNRQLPVCLYGEMEIRSAGGVYGVLEFSRANAADRFIAVVRVLADSELPPKQMRPTSLHLPIGRWTILFI
jgi:hypothetical protein